MQERVIPVIADSVKEFEGASLLRCTYFYVAIDDTELVWVVGTAGLKGTTFMVGGNPVLSVEPELASTLSSEDEIEALFAGIEEDGNQTVETAPLWVPHDIVAKVLGQDPVPRGAVLRLNVPLFHAAFRYGEGTVTKDEMEAVWREQVQALGRDAPERDSAAFGRWMHAQIKQSKDRHDTEDEDTKLKRKSER
jgi:hypothetical protein